jgi:hypothetical protein
MAQVQEVGLRYFVPGKPKWREMPDRRVHSIKPPNPDKPEPKRQNACPAAGQGLRAK